MKRARRFSTVFFLAAALAYAAVPRLISVAPDAGKPGDELVASGQNLDSSNVTKLFLTAGGKDHQVKIKEQTSDSIRFIIPEKIEFGSYNLMIQTGGATPTLYEQPVRCTVENEEMARQRAEEDAASRKKPRRSKKSKRSRREKP